MSDRLRRRDADHLRQRKPAERPAGGGEDDLFHLVGVVEVEHLVDGAVFRIDGHQRCAAAGDLGHHQAAGANQALLVGEADDGAAPYRRHRRRQSGGAHDRRHDLVGRQACRIDDGIVAGGDLDTGPGEPFLQLRIARGIGDDGAPRPEPPRLVGEQRDVAVGGNRHDIEGAGVMFDQLDGIGADRPG